MARGLFEKNTRGEGYIWHLHDGFPIFFDTESQAFFIGERLVTLETTSFIANQQMYGLTWKFNCTGDDLAVSIPLPNIQLEKVDTLYYAHKKSYEPVQIGYVIWQK